MVIELTKLSASGERSAGDTPAPAQSNHHRFNRRATPTFVLFRFKEILLHSISASVSLSRDILLGQKASDTP
jgi:hypothetical protein